MYKLFLVTHSRYDTALSRISLCKTTAISAIRCQSIYFFLKRKKKEFFYKQQIFQLNFQKICHVTYKNKTNKTKCAINDIFPLRWQPCR